MEGFREKKPLNYPMEIENLNETYRLMILFAKTNFYLIFHLKRNFVIIVIKIVYFVVLVTIFLVKA